MADTLKRHQIERYAVDSSSVRSIGYAGGVCVVEFMRGHLYAYPMTPDQFERFARAPSKGQYFNTEIRGKYEGEKLTGRCGRCGSEPEVIGEVCADCGTAVVRAVDTIHGE